MSADPNTDGKFFSVHLQSLERFADELQTRLDELRRPLDGLHVLTQHGLALGSFGEAYDLGAHHARVADQTYSLLQAVCQAVGFAGEVTKTVVGSYRRYDQQAAAALGPSTPGATPPAQLRVTVTQPPFTYSVPPGQTATGG